MADIYLNPSRFHPLEIVQAAASCCGDDVHACFLYLLKLQKHMLELNFIWYTESSFRSSPMVQCCIRLNIWLNVCKIPSQVIHLFHPFLSLTSSSSSTLWLTEQRHLSGLLRSLGVLYAKTDMGKSFCLGELILFLMNGDLFIHWLSGSMKYQRLHYWFSISNKLKKVNISFNLVVFKRLTVQHQTK